MDVRQLYDVAIVGCGPVGAFAANALGAAGLSVLILDKDRDVTPTPRACHIDHEAMRLFQSVGLAQRLEPHMAAAQGNLHVGADGGVIRYVGTAGQAPRFGWASDYFFFQPELEGILRDGLARFPTVDVRLGVKVDDLRQDGRGVRLWASNGMAGVLKTRARYVIACDGARSTVRRTLGVELDDQDFEEPWLVVDAEVDGPIQFPELRGVPPDADLQRLSVMLCDPRRPTTLVPGRGRHRRWEFMILPGEDEQAMTAPEAVARLLSPWIEAERCNLIRAATYRFHGLIARRWRTGRVFLAGDAAHQTPPFFGQGMCHGLRDVSNLAWKLTRVLSGGSSPRLLDTYQAERAPQVAAVVAEAIAAGRYICQLDPRLAAERDDRLRRQMAAGAAAPPREIIPAYAEGVLGPGGGERFIQPIVRSTSGRDLLLDDLTGGGFAIIRRAPSSQTIPKALLSRVGARVFDVGKDLEDRQGALAAWFDDRRAVAVIVRPDFYVFGLAHGEAQLAPLIDQLARQLASAPEPAVPRMPHA